MTPAKPVLFVHSSNELYGSDRSLLELVRRLDPDRYRPVVALPVDLPYRGDLTRALREVGVPVFHVDMAILRRRYMSPVGLAQLACRLWTGTRALGHIVRTRHIALVHSNSSAVLCGATASARHRLPHVWYVREMAQASPWVRRLLAWIVAARATRIVVNSAAVRAYLLQDVPQAAAKIVVIPPPVDTARFTPDVDGRPVREAWGVGPEEVLFGVVGRLHWWKGQDVFLRAAARLAREAPRARFVLVGDVVPGEEARRERLQALARDLGIARRVIWAGYRDDMPEVMAALDVLVLPSTAPEPFGRVLIEAMATAKPVIATAHGGPLEIVEPEKTGLLVPPGNPEALAAAMRTLYARPDLRRRLGEAGLVRVRERYTIDQHVRAFDRLYTSLLDPDMGERPL